MDPMDLIFFDSELPLSPAQKFAAVFTAWMRLVIIDGGFIFTSDFCRKKHLEWFLNTPSFVDKSRLPFCRLGIK